MPRKPCSPSGYGSKKTGDITLKATVEWMACDEGSCLPPEERTLTFTIRGASAGQTAGGTGATGTEETGAGGNEACSGHTADDRSPRPGKRGGGRTESPLCRRKFLSATSHPLRRIRRPRAGRMRRQRRPLPPNRTSRKAHFGLPPCLPHARPEKDRCGPPSSRPCCGDWRPC